MSQEQVVYRYSKVLFDISKEKNQLDDVQVYLQYIQKFLVHNEHFRVLIHNPLLLASEREKILRSIFSSKIPDVLLNFLLFLNFKGRINILDELIVTFDALYLEMKNQLKVDLKTAYPITETQIKSINEKLSAKFNKSVLLSSETTPDLIGGFKLFVEGRLFDSSIKTQLSLFKQKVLN